MANKTFSVTVTEETYKQIQQAAKAAFRDTKKEAALMLAESLETRREKQQLLNRYNQVKAASSEN